MKRYILFLFFISGSISLWADRITDLKTVFPQAEKVLEVSQPFSHTAFLKNKELIGACFLASALISNTRGFSGDIEALICIDREARIRKVRVISQSETPGWGDKIEEESFLRQFEGKSLNDYFRIGEDIQGITGATISSRSLARIVKEASSKAYQELFKERKFFSLKFYLDKDVFLVGIFMGLAFLFVLGRSLFLRWVYLILVIVYSGFLRGLFISIFNILKILELKVPSWEDSLSWYIFFVFSFLGTVFLGRFYCGWLCPFGGVQEFFSKLPFKKLKIPYQLNNCLLKVKYLILILALFLFLRGKDFLFKLEPFNYFFSLNFLSVFFYYSLLILVICLFIPRFFCRYLCFVGAIFSVLSYFSLLKYKLDCPKPSCKACIRSCPVGVIDADKVIKDEECIRCNICQSCSVNKKL